MDIFVGTLSPNASIAQLMDFFKAFSKQASFEIRRYKGEKGLLIFGIVSIPSERLAKKAIKRLHCKKLNNRIVAVREFTHRAASNDNRELNWRDKKWNTVERRRIDRRTCWNEIKKNFNSYAA